jgi:NAD(P)-dependent dehydrogenase (short-subunit alcohol dehydrogenase family)
VGAYHASKYAVVGLSEALRAELEPAGIGVSMICPGGVNTRIAEAERNRPAAMGPASSLGRAGPPNAVGRMEPADIARLVVRGVRENRKFIITHPERRREVADRCEHLLAAFDQAAAEEQATAVRG